MREEGNILTDAKITYWQEDDKDTATPTPTVTPTVTPTPTKKPASASKKINTLKLTKYKKGTKVVAGKTLAKASVSVKIGGKTYKTTASKSGAFTINLKSKLKKKDTIKVTVTKSGYTKKVMSFKVK